MLCVSSDWIGFTCVSFGVVVATKSPWKCFHKSAFVSSGVYPTGISLSSILKHRNSPSTHMMVAQIALRNHHENVAGNSPLYAQQMHKCTKWYVQVKSKQSFVRPTMNRSTNAPMKAFSTNDKMTDRPPESVTWISWNTNGKRLVDVEALWIVNFDVRHWLTYVVLKQVVQCVIRFNNHIHECHDDA